MPLDTPTVWLLTYLLHSTVLALVALIALTLAPGLRPAARVVVARAALLGPLVTTTGAMLAPTGGTVALPAGATATSVIALPSELPASASSHDGAPLPSAAGALFGAPGGAAPPRVEQPRGRTMLSVALTVLAILAVLRLLALARSELRAWRRLNRRRPVRDSRLLAQVEGLLHGATVSECAGLGAPLALGRLEVVVHSGSLARLTPAEREALLAHECGHLARRDPAWLGLARVTASATCFQPLQRVLLGRLERDTELAADAWAAARTQRPLALARCLETVGGWLVSGPRPCASVAMARGRSALVERVEALCAMPTDVAVPRTGAMTLAVVAVVALIACTGPAVREADAADSHVAQGLDGAAAWAHFEAAMSGGTDDLLDPDLAPTRVAVRTLESRGHRVDFTPRTWDTAAPELWIELTAEDGAVAARAFGQRFADLDAAGAFLERLAERRRDVRIVLSPDESVAYEAIEPLVDAAVIANFNDIDLVARGPYPVEDGPLLLDHEEMPDDDGVGSSGLPQRSAGPFIVTRYDGTDAQPGERRFMLTYLPRSGLDRLPADGIVTSQWVLDFLRKGMRRGPIPGLGIEGLSDRFVVEIPPENEFSFVTAWFENAARPTVLAWKTEFKLTTGDEVVSLFLPTDMDVAVEEEVPEDGVPSSEPVEQVEVRIERGSNGTRYRVGPRLATDPQAAAESALALHRAVGNGRPVKIDARPDVLAGDVFPLVLALSEADVPMVLVGTYLVPDADRLLRGRGR